AQWAVRRRPRWRAPSPSRSSPPFPPPRSSARRAAADRRAEFRVMAPSSPAEAPPSCVDPARAEGSGQTRPFTGGRPVNKRRQGGVLVDRSSDPKGGRAMGRAHLEMLANFLVVLYLVTHGVSVPREGQAHL